MKRSFFQAAVASIVLYGCTKWTLTKRLEKKLDGNYTRMLRAILNISWWQHPTRHQLYGHLPPITKTIQVRRARHAGHCWRSRDERISDVLLWTPTYGRAKVGRPARTYIQQLCEDTGCSPEELPEAMNEKWRERVRDILVTSTTWWWWYIYIYIYMPLCEYIFITIYKILSERVFDFIITKKDIFLIKKKWQNFIISFFVKFLNLQSIFRKWSLWVTLDSSRQFYLYIYIYIYIIIIIIISCWQHGYPWPSLATPPYRSSP